MSGRDNESQIFIIFILGSVVQQNDGSSSSKVPFSGLDFCNL